MVTVKVLALELAIKTLMCLHQNWLLGGLWGPCDLNITRPLLGLLFSPFPDIHDSVSYKPPAVEHELSHHSGLLCLLSHSPLQDPVVRLYLISDSLKVRLWTSLN